MKKKTIAALAAGGALLLAAVVIGVLSLVRGYFILLPPTHMQLNGQTEEHIAAFAAYTDPGARLLRGGDPTDAAVTVEGRVNTDVPGDYTLTYQANFRGRSYTAKRLVHVEDREAPELALTGQAEVTVSRYDLFQDPGATARDRCDGDLTASIQVTDKASGDVHTLTYTVTDKAGNAATATRRVTVRDIVAPVITLSGQRELFVPLGGAYQEPGYTAQDDADGDLTASVTRAGTVNTASPGVYTLTYTVTDKAGNTAEMTVTVNDGHTFGEWVSNGDGTHTRKCTVDGCNGLETKDCSGGKATCKDKAVCEVCGKAYGEPDPKNHTDLKHIPAKAATEDAEGNIEYWYCSGCNQYYSDKYGTKEIKKADTVTAKLPKSPPTGDTSNLMLWIAPLFISGGACTVLTVKRKKSYRPGGNAK